MRPDSAIRIVVCLTLALSAEAATITIDGEGSALLTWHNEFGSGYLSGLIRGYFPPPNYTGPYNPAFATFPLNDAIQDGTFDSYLSFHLPPVEDVIGLRMDIHPLQSTIHCESDCAAYGDSWLTSLEVAANGVRVDVPVSSSSIDLLTLGPEFFPRSDEETSYYLFFHGRGGLTAPSPFYPPTEPGWESFYASMRLDLPATLTATTLVVPEPRYYAIAGGLFLACVFVSRRGKIKH
jgi:hypothetical protein